jgi:general secretion pathway protein H
MTWRSRGFTLVELLIVLAIMAAATALFMTYVQTGTTGAQLRAATREMSAALSETRSAAITANRVTALVIDTRNRRYREAGREHVVPARLGLTVAGAVPVPGDERSGAIYFFPDGSSSGGVIDFAAGTASEAVTVDWFTGHAIVQALRATR